MKILITGGGGYLATKITSSLSEKYEITSITRNDFNLLDENLTRSWFKDKHYDVVIHTAIVGGSRLKNDTTDVVYKNIKMYNLAVNIPPPLY